MRYTILTAAAVALGWAALTPADTPARPPTPTSAPTTTKAPASAPAPAPAAAADRLAPYILAIRQTDNFRAAMAAYARACGIDNESVELNDAYMRRLLQLGLPEIAYYPARVLTVIDRANGTAWGVLGYHQARKGDFTSALTSSIRGAEHSPNDPSILNNVGQLLAWYDGQFDQPDLPDSVRRSLDKLRDSLAAQKDFQRAYDRIRRAYQDTSTISTELSKKMAVAESEARAAEQAASDLLGQIEQLNSDIEYRQRELDWYDYYYRFSFLHPLIWQTPSAGYSYPGGANLILVMGLRDRLHGDEQAIAQLKAKSAALRRDGEGVLAQCQGKNDELAGLQGQARVAALKVGKTFRWDPPAVDGVVTAELDRLPPDRAVSPAAANGSTAPKDPDAEADQRLAMARLYLNNDLSDQASAILTAIVKDYPKSPAAATAKTLIATLKQ